ncbi:MAG TPA: polysaccharide deacetylase family protein [Thermoleophilaceae bacterium]
MTARAVRATAWAGGLAAAGWCLPALAPRVPLACRALGAPRRIDSDRAVAVTFDDGPHPEGTPAVLAALAAAGATATFFLVGEQVERDPALAREVAAAGHAVGVHAHRHRLPLRLTSRAFADDLARAHAAIADAAGVRPALYRPPYGKFSWPGLRAVRARGLDPLLWSRDSRDFTPGARVDSIVAAATRDLRGGDVILLHDSDAYGAEGSHRRTAAALPRVLEEIARRGLETAAG